jgi:hypothetical protein
VYGAGMMFSLIQENYDTSKLNIIELQIRNLTLVDKLRAFSYVTIDILISILMPVLIAIYVTSPIIRFLKEDVLLPSDKLL